MQMNLSKLFKANPLTNLVIVNADSYECSSGAYDIMKYDQFAMLKQCHSIWAEKLLVSCSIQSFTEV